MPSETDSPAFAALVAAGRAYQAARTLAAQDAAWRELQRLTGDERRVMRLALEYAAVEAQLRRACGDIR